MERVSNELSIYGKGPGTTELWFWRVAALAGLCFTFFYGLVKQLERGVWHDEALTTFFISLDWRELFSLMAQYEANMGLYYVLLKIWSTVSMSELWLRIFSLSAHIATGALLYSGAKRYLGVRSAYFFLTLFLSHYLLVRYSVEIRGYALAMLLIALLWTAWMRLVVDKDSRWWPAYAVIGAIAVHSHLLVSIALFFSGLFLLFAVKDRSDFMRWVVCHILMVASFLPLLAFAITKESGQLGWISTPTITALIYSLSDVSGAYGYAGKIVRYFTFILVFSVLPLLILCHILPRSRKDVSLKIRLLSKSSLAAVLYGFCLPLSVILGVFVLSHIEPAFSTRFFIPYIPLLILSAAFVMTKPPLYRIALAPLPLLFMASTLSYGDRGDIGWQNVQRAIKDQCHSADSIIFITPSSQSGFRFYENITQSECDLKIFPYQISAENYLEFYDLNSIDWPKLLNYQRDLVVLAHTDYSMNDVKEHYSYILNVDWNCNSIFYNHSISVYECN